MNDRKRQQKKVLRMYARSAKRSDELLVPKVLLDKVSDAIRALGEATVKVANTMAEWLNSEGVQKLVAAMERYEEVDDE